VRVAIVTESFLPSVNGVTNSVLRVIDTLSSRGDQVIVVAPTTPGDIHLSYSVIQTPSVLLAGFPVAIPTSSVAKALDDFEPDVVHAAAPFWLGGYAIAHAAKRGRPSVAVYQTDVAGYMARYGLDFAAPILDAATAAIHKPATLTLAPTPDGVEYLRGLGVDNVYEWGRGVDTELFSPEKRTSPGARALRETVAPNGERVIGYVGRLAPEKQVERFTELVGISNTKILIVGDGPSRSQLEALFRDDNVVFTGRLEGDDLAHAYAAMDVFVHCGTEETFGQTIQEAHASGLPVIAPQVGGQRHLIRQGVDGYVVDHWAWGAFRGAVERVLEDPDLLSWLSQNAVRAVQGKTWQANNEKLLDYYSQAQRAHQGEASIAA
jgi:phosphatidylinositol alpha 1,6-mannosyltransferase